MQQITRENIIESEATTGKQYAFEYDLYGNKLCKTESTYTVATGAITGSATAQFSYTDSTWKDLLTSRGNMSFTYAEAMIGVFSNEGFTAKASVGAGFVFRVKPAQ